MLILYLLECCYTKFDYPYIAWHFDKSIKIKRNLNSQYKKSAVIEMLYFLQSNWSIFYVKAMKNILKSTSWNISERDAPLDILIFAFDQWYMRHEVNCLYVPHINREKSEHSESMISWPLILLFSENEHLY